MLPAHPDPALERWLEQVGRRVGLVFVDLVESSELFQDENGTERYGTVINAYRERATRLAESCGGRILSRQGDGIFAVFPTAVGAYRFARDMFDDAGHPTVVARAGVHFGTVRPDESSVMGRVVPLTQRIMDHGKKGGRHELWVSNVLKDMLQAEAPAVADAITWITSEECTLTGFPAPQRLWRAG